MRDGVCYRLPDAERLTFAKDSGLLPAPAVSEFTSNVGGSNGRVGKIRYSLTGMARYGLFPTPTDMSTKASPLGPLATPLNPLALALSAGATFVAQAFSGNQAQLVAILEAVTKFEEVALLIVADYEAATKGLPATERTVELEMIL